MCGIVGYLGSPEKSHFLVEGLKRLEYRGYDSFGILTLNDETPAITRMVGQITDFSSLHNKHKHSIGIGHTRWATHGKVCFANTHPIEYKGVYVVHNGIVTNPNVVCGEDETDTLHIAQMYRASQISRFKFISELEGSGRFPCGAFLIIDDNIPFRNSVYAYSNGSPLFYGRDEENNIYIASDPLAFSGYCDEFCVIPQKTLYKIKKGEVWFDAHKKYQVPNYENKMVEDHHMLSEIKEQPEIVAKMKHSLPIRKLYHPTFIGCGSSYIAGKLGVKYFNKHGFIANALYASEIDEYTIPLSRNIVPISQSGETKDVINAVKTLRTVCDFYSIINKPHSSLYDLSNLVTDMQCGPEIGVAATKSFMATAMILLNWARKSARIDSPIPTGLFRDYLERTLKQADRIKHIAEEYKDYQHMIILGSGLNYPIACEAALKIKEVAYIHAEAIPANEIKHGPIALVDDKTVFLFLNPYADNMAQIRSRGGKILQIESLKCDQPSLNPLITLVDMQLFAYYLAVAKGVNPDKPRHLAKSVTV